jgi:Putative transmembrane protein (PGPGW)
MNSRSSAGAPLRMARKVVVAVAGCTVLAIGIALIVLPRPAFIVIPCGVAILATEFVWARRLLRRVRERAIVRGVFGVPTFVMGAEIFWGHDAFDMVLDYLRDSAQFQDAEMQRIEDLPVGVVRPRPQ